MYPNSQKTTTTTLYVKKKHSCGCPWLPQTWVVLAGFFIVVLLQNMAQQYPDSQPEYPEECQNLSDLGFDIIPFLGVTWLSESGTDFNSIADVWILASLATAALLFLFVFARTQLIFRRFFICYGTVFLFRGLTVMATVYPRLPFKSNNFVSDNVLWGALLILSGVRTTARDMMFSGHTAGFILSASFVGRYTNSSILRFFYWVFNALGVVALIAVREHYTADVIVSIIVARLVFVNYHLWLDSQYIRFWKPGIEIVSVKPTRLFPPFLLQDSQGNTERVEVAGVSKSRLVSQKRNLSVIDVNKLEGDNFLVANSVTETIPLKEPTPGGIPRSVLTLNTWKFTNWTRFRWYSFWHWLDAE